MTTSRVPRLPVDEAKAAADEAAVPDYMAELSTANLPPVLPSGRPRSPTPRCGSFRSGTSMLRSCSGWRNIRSTGWTSLIAMRRHLCGAHSAKASRA
jgi:hypothetical protein